MRLDWTWRVVGGVGGALAAWMFFPHVLLLPIGVFWGQAFLKKEREHLEARKLRQEMEDGFRFFLEAFSAALQSGATTVQAVRYAKDNVDQQKLAPRFIDTVNALLGAYQGGDSLEKALLQWSNICQTHLITNFCENLCLGIRKGADLCALSEVYLRILEDEQKSDKERKTLLSASIREQRLLLCMPFVFLFLLRSSGMVEAEGSLLNMIIHGICALLFYLAYRWMKSIHHAQMGAFTSFICKDFYTLFGSSSLKNFIGNERKAKKCAALNSESPAFLGIVTTFCTTGGWAHFG